MDILVSLNDCVCVSTTSGDCRGLVASDGAASLYDVCSGIGGVDLDAGLELRADGLAEPL